MKRLIALALCALVAAPAMAAQQNITTVSSATASREALRTALNLRLTDIDENFDELYTAIGTRPWVAQATAPADTTLLWFDTDQVPGEVVLKIYTGGAWVAHAIGTGGGDYTLPAATAEALGGVKVGARLSITDGVLAADDQVSSLTAASVGLGTDSNPSFNSVHASGGNLAAANKQVTKAWATGLPYTADVTSVIHGGNHYICTSTHTAGSTTEPGVGASWATVWEVASGSSFDEAGNFTLTGEWDFTSATVTGLGTAILPPRHRRANPASQLKRGLRKYLIFCRVDK